MKTIATNPRSWCGVFLTAAEWNKLRPRVKEMDVRYNVSGIHEPDFTGVEPLVPKRKQTQSKMNWKRSETGAKRTRKGCIFYTQKSE